MAIAALIVLIVSSFVTTSLFATRGQYQQSAERLKAAQLEALSRRGIETARNLAGSIAAPLLDGDVSRVRDNVDAVAKNSDDMTECLATRTDGRTIARVGKGTLGERVPDKFIAELGALKGAEQLKSLWDGSTRKAVGYAAPIALSGRVLGYAYVELSTEKIEAALQAIDADRRRATQSAVLKAVTLGAIGLGLGILVAVFLGFRFSGAVRSLAAVALEVGRGNLTARAKWVSNDELGVLANRFNDMTEKIDHLMKETVAKAAIDQELQRASAIQAMLVPSTDLAEHAGLQYCGFCESATQVGGDWWHHYRISDTKVLLCVGDVTGHGIPSAMLTASAKASCDVLLRDATNLDLSRFLQSLDYVIREAGKGEFVMTFFAALFDTATRTVTFANAGHNFPVLIRGGKVKSLLARGGRLGDGTTFEPVTVELEENDLIVLFSDGIIECANPAGEEYGTRRFVQVLKNNATADLRDLRTRVVENAYNFFADNPRADDITLVLCRVRNLARAAKPAGSSGAGGPPPPPPGAIPSGIRRTGS